MGGGWEGCEERKEGIMEQYHEMHEVMERLKLTRDTLTRCIKKGKIPGTVKIGGAFRIPESGVEQFLTSQLVKSPDPFNVPRRKKLSKSKSSPAVGVVPLTMDIFRKD